MTNEEFEVYIKFKLLDADFTGWNYAAMDSDKHVYLYILEPSIEDGISRWISQNGVWTNIDELVVIDTNQLDIFWHDTLVKL